MKKKWILVLTFLLSIVMLFSCGQQTEKGTETEGKETEPQQVITEPDGSFAYSIVRSDSGAAYCLNASKQLAQVIANVLQLPTSKIKLATDWVNKGEEESVLSAKEIIIGKTTRVESVETLKILQKDQYALKYFPDTHKIVIIGYDDVHTQMAVEYFVEKIIGYNLEDGSFEARSALTIPEKMDIIMTEAYVPIDRTTGVQLAQTVYSTDDVVVADIIVKPDNYGVDPNGVNDSSEGIQKALTDCSKKGGGTVFLPTGKYLITKNITIPSFVTLRGDWQDPDTGKEYGTTILAKVATSQDDTVGLFNIGGSAGVVGLTVYYPDQKLDNVKPYSPTFYIPGGQNDTFMDQTVRNVTLVNSYIGIGCTTDGVKNHEQLYINNVKATCLFMGGNLMNESDVGTLQKWVISPRYWSKYVTDNGLSAVSEEDIAKYTRKHATGLFLGDLDWPQFSGITITDCQTSIHIVKGTRSNFCGSFYDVVALRADYGLIIEEGSLDMRWGLQLSNSYLEGSKQAINNKTDGVVKMAGTTVSGLATGYVMYDTDNLSAYKSDAVLSYKTTPIASNLFVFTYGKGTKNDISENLQTVLNKAGEKGGIVYIPAGIYVLNQPVTIPSGVELRGSGAVATRDEENCNLGAMILSEYLINKTENAPALFNLEAKSGIRGFRIEMIANGAKKIDKVTAIRGNGESVYAINCSINTAGYGIDFSKCDQHFIQYITSFCYYSDLLLGGKDGYVADFLHNATLPVRIGNAFSYRDGSNFLDFLNASQANTTSIVLDNSQNEHIERVFSYGVKSMLKTGENAKDTLVINLGTDNTAGTQLVFDGGNTTVINVMRYNGKSMEKSSKARVQVYVRLAIWDQWEPDITTHSGEVMPVEILNYKVLNSCDSGLSGMSRLTSGQLEGNGCATVSLKASPNNFISMNNFLKQDASAYNGIVFDLYLSDAKMLNHFNCFVFELTSSGTCDQEEYEWVVGLDRRQEMNEGWNTIFLQFDDATRNGTIDLTRVNFFRVFAFWEAGAVGEELRIDNIRFCETTGRDYEGYGFTMSKISVDDGIIVTKGIGPVAIEDRIKANAIIIGIKK